MEDGGGRREGEGGRKKKDPPPAVGFPHHNLSVHLLRGGEKKTAHCS